MLLGEQAQFQDSSSFAPIQDYSSPQPTSILQIKTKQILSGFSMAEKYSMLLSENVTLVLPVHYKHLFNLFIELDTALNFLRLRKTTATFKNVSSYIENSMKRKFTLQHFQQILTVAPQFYIHKWEQKGKGYELIIEIPKNIRQLIPFSQENKEAPSQDAFENIMQSDITEVRKSYFKDNLYSITLQHYEKAKEQHKDAP